MTPTVRSFYGYFKLLKLHGKERSRKEDLISQLTLGLETSRAEDRSITPNTNEIPGELSCENTISSLVKRSPLLWLHNKSRLSQEKKNLTEMVLYSIGFYIINRTLHGRLDIRNFSSRLVLKIFQHSKRNFVSPHVHVISSMYQSLPLILNSCLT